jgi:putative membrane protein
MMKGISPSRLARTITFLILSFFIVWLIDTGKLNHIVHPRMTPWIMIAGLLFLVLAASELLRLTKGLRKPDPFSYFYPYIFILAIAYLFVQATTLKPSQFQASPEETAFKAAVISQRSSVIDKTETMPFTAWISMNDDTYWPIYNRLYDNPAAVLGKRITVQGFVYHDKALPPKIVLIGRNLMWCCSADMSVIGFLVEEPRSPEFKDDTWVEVTGSLDTIRIDVSGNGEAVPVPLIKAVTIKQIAKSVSSTIFPY